MWMVVARQIRYFVARAHPPAIRLRMACGDPRGARGTAGEGLGGSRGSAVHPVLLDSTVMGEALHRPAVRIICLDETERVLLMSWRDPFDGSIVWEPPGGGIEDGETPLATARRELVEETGLDPSPIGIDFVDVHRDTTWKGQRWVGAEQFFLARFAGNRPLLRLDGQMAYEQDEFQTYAWVAPDGLGDLDGRLEPPHLATVIAGLVPGGHW
jgi:8-oxo-dGTP pyrophosphatase MutT (NUDIX family)